MTLLYVRIISKWIKRFFLEKTKTVFSHNTSILLDNFFLFSDSNIVKVFDEMGYAWNLCLHHIYLYLSLLLPFHFSFLEPPSSHASLFLTEINPSLLVKSQMKLDTLDSAQLWPSAQMIRVKANNPGHHHSNIYIHGAFNKFPDFFVQAFKIVIDSWKFNMLLLYILWDHWPIFMISGSNEQLQQQLEYTLLKPDWHSWWISKMQSGHEDTLEERYAINFCFELGKNATETYGMLFDHLAWIEHQFLSGIRDSRKARSLWGMMRGVGGVRKSIDLSWPNRVNWLRLLCWGFKGVQEEIPSEEASTLQFGSVAFPRGQCTSLQLHPCHRLFDQDGYQYSSSPSLWSRPCSLWLLVFPLAQGKT